MPSSSMRRLLAFYLDFLVFSALLTPTAWVIERLGGSAVTPMQGCVLFVLLRVALVRFVGTSPGRWCLGISPDSSTVDVSIANREAWWTMLAGTLLVLEGSKNLVRWTEGLPPQPFLGNGVSDTTALAVLCLLGLLNLVAGVLILRTHAIGSFLGASVVTFETLATLAHRQAFRDWVASSVSARRAIQGIPPRAGQIAFMQDFVSSYLPLVMAAGAFYLVVVGVRLLRRRTA